MNNILLANFVIIGVIALAWVAFYVRNIIMKHRKYDISFKESMDLTDLPVVTFYCGSRKLNFLLDTGSNSSHINSVIMEKAKNMEDAFNGKTLKFMGVEGNEKTTKVYNLRLTYNNTVFDEEFSATDLTKAFSAIKKETGVQVHGILGSVFLQKYKYIIDFDKLKVHIRK